MTREEQDKRMAEIDGWSPGDLMLHIVLLEAALRQAREKLTLYREQHSGAYIGGVEYTELLRRIDEALTD